MHADKTYCKLLTKILEEGTDKTDRTGTGTRSLFGEQLKFDLREGFPLLTTKRIHWKSVLHELLWIMRGDTNIKYLVDNGVSIWNDWPYKHYRQHTLNMYAGHVNPLTMDEFVAKIRDDDNFAREWGRLGPVYGKQWRRWAGAPSADSFEETGVYIEREEIDQLQLCVDTLLKQPDSRRMIVSAWNPEDTDAMARAGLPPCHMIFQFNTRPISTEERRSIAAHRNIYPVDDQLDSVGIPAYRLDLMMTQRSADVLLGVPFNIASYAALTHIVANVVNMVPGVLTMSFGDVHIYNNHFDQVKEQLTRTPFGMPKLFINRQLAHIDDVQFDDVQLVDYQSWGPIKAPVAV